MIAKKYRAIFFDWDGTAVENRRAPVDKVLPPMIALLNEAVKLAIISGTTYENVAGGRLHGMIPGKCLSNLYMGLGRGAFDYGFRDGEPYLLQDNTPVRAVTLAIHKLCFDIHTLLIERYGYSSDIVFTRPNYCKIDIMVGHNRGDRMFLQAGESERVNEALRAHGYDGGLRGLCDLAEAMGRERGLKLKATTDAKFIEVGTTTKGDNVDFLVQEVLYPAGIGIGEMCFWGDEYTYLGEGIQGSDSQMITEITAKADFFDVSPSPLRLPQKVVGIGGGIESFERFLREQVS